MRMTIRKAPLNLADLCPRTNYLTRENACSSNEYIYNLQNAINSGDKNVILGAANDLLKNERRNDTIARHENTIATVTELMKFEMKPGDMFSIDSVATAISNSYPHLCKVTKSGRQAPLGAVIVAICRMMENGEVKVAVIKKGYHFSRVFVMA